MNNNNNYESNKMEQLDTHHKEFFVLLVLTPSMTFIPMNRIELDTMRFVASFTST